MSMTDEQPGVSNPGLSDEALAAATRKARWAASPADWLSLALDHHDAIRDGFEVCRTAQAGRARLTAMKRLAVVLNGHAMAEELVLYPALAQFGDKVAAGQAYAEQTVAKLQMAELERLDPACDRWPGKLEQMRNAVLQHMYQEETGWFLDLKDQAEDQTYLARRFQEEFERYVWDDWAAPAPPEPRSFDPAPATTGALDRY